MKLAAIFATAAIAAAQTPDVATPKVAEIMERVGKNQTDSQELRRQYTFHQKQLLRMNRGGGKVAREEHREYEISPGPHGVVKDLAHFDGRYGFKGKYVSYDRPGYQYKDMDIDGDLIDDLSDSLTNDKDSRDGIACHLFPLTANEQRKYTFQLKGVEQFRGHQVYRVTFEPKPHQDFDQAGWKGDALIDTVEFQPVQVHTTLALKIPLLVKTLLGTDIKGLGFSVSYQKFEDGVWFPVSYGGEFEVRAVFFYKRTISVNMTNTEFHRSHVNSNVTYMAEK